MTLCSLLYTLGNYDKAFANQMGFLQLLFSIYAITLLIVRIRKKASGLSLYVYILYAIAQILPITFWITLSFAKFYVFPGIIYTINAGLPLHIILFLWSIAACIIKAKHQGKVISTALDKERAKIETKTKWKRFSLVVAALIVIGLAVATLFPVISINVIFDRCLNMNEVTTVFHDTSFKAYQYSSVSNNMSWLSTTSNSKLFSAPLEGAALENALNAEFRNTGIIVIDGTVTLLDMMKIKNKPFVDGVIVYILFFRGFDRDVLPDSTMQFYEKHPEARYWE
jgi:hypothetical protein